MKILKVLSIIGFFGVIVLIFLFSSHPLKKDDSDGKIQVSASFYPLAYLVTKVGGTHVSVHNMLPSGGEPHDFEPALRDFTLLGKSTLFLYNGAHFEPWIEKWEQGSFTRPSKVLNMTEELVRRGAPLITKDGQINPHIWVNPKIFVQEVEIVRDTLVQIDPPHAFDYWANADQLTRTLQELDQNFRDGLAQCEKKDIIVSHDAFQYLSQEYGFSSISIAGISPDEEPSLKVLAQIAEIARIKNIKYIFFETTASPKLSETVAREVGAGTLVLNPIESITEHSVQLGEDYISTMMMNLNNLRKALVCQ